MKRGEVWLISLDPTVGSEIQKTRPCLVISPDDINAILRRIIVAPMTSRSHPAPFRVETNFRRKPGLVLLDQIRAVDRQRLVARLGVIDPATLTNALQLLRDMFGE